MHIHPQHVYDHQQHESLGSSLVGNLLFFSLESGCSASTKVSVAGNKKRKGRHKNGRLNYLSLKKAGNCYRKQWVYYYNYINNILRIISIRANIFQLI